MKNNTSLSLLAAISILTANFASAQSLLIDYNFNSLTANAALSGQDGWVNLSSAGNDGPVVRSFTPTNLSGQQGAGWSTTGTGAARSYRDFGNFNLTTAFTVTIEFDLIRVGSVGQALLGIGSSQVSPEVIPASVGTFSSLGWAVRGTNDAVVTYAVDNSGSTILAEQNNLYRVRSVWDLGASTASLAVKNLSAGETDFTTLYFNQDQNQSTATLGTLGDVTLWSDLNIRTGGGNLNQGGFLDNVVVTAVPEPSVAALLAGGLAVLLLARRRK